ncbi:putative von Willebrand factor A-like domain superfamily [Helianthus annuus]|uniref:von Willebrand factor A-like domain superfamily n=2 Tax=Helianthus annuus TaxID=4232 RepID=A0A251SXD8_HELAN|nr:uncharacterized protein LOC110900022 isoform X1 [Helianthus annuus]KAF5775460.1 putative von Willebrand factor A-like domain superfamily [Helianthus annuus]KAJ0483413.1 putative von Willebrand factor A-like domain superfamily [Helianthus annuus]KAJ0851211.1 putative von Willebrand factor A-like domain superfamily [Helianthus annuus]
MNPLTGDQPETTVENLHDAITNSTTTLSLNNQPIITVTENSSATYITSQNPCLDFFFHTVPDTPPEHLINRLDLAWSHNPLTTLKLICNLRSVRGTGKSDKQSFYTAAIWLHNNHPKTLAYNIPILVEFGYFKDLLEILYLLIEGPEARKVAKSEWISKKSAKGKGMARKIYFLSKKKKKKKNGDDEMKAKLRARVPREQRIEENRAQMKAERERAKSLRREKESAMVEKARDRYDSDPDYRLLHDQVSMFFAGCLRSDIELLNSGDCSRISLAAKWCPSVDSSYDKATLICESIGKLIYPRDSDPEFGEIDDVSYVFRVKNLLRKQVLVPLRNALKLPEVYMSAKQWSSISYDRVASIAMKNYTDIFLHRDNERFRKYLENVKTGDAKIAAGALLPHEIIGGLSRGSGASIVAELQWKRMVDDLSKKGKLTNCIAVCDVSGSMSGTPMEVSVALGLLVSELSAEPWKGHVITFSESPELHLIEGHNLRSKTEFIRNMNWGMNTNFQKVFDKLLEVGVNGKLSEDDMVKRVFVFSDMEFDQASSDPWETDFEAIERKFKGCGYERVPEIVFWNLRDSSSTPVTANQKGVALLSGFSKNLLTLFLEEGGVIKPEDIKPNKSGVGDGDLNPEDTMEAAISGELYQKLVVID